MRSQKREKDREGKVNSRKKRKTEQPDIMKGNDPISPELMEKFKPEVENNCISIYNYYSYSNSILYSQGNLQKLEFSN